MRGIDIMNNKKIVNELWQEYEPYIRKLCNYKLKSLPAYIDDCIQDVFLDLSDALNKGNVIKYPKAWLTKVANNKIRDIYAQAKKETEKIVPLEKNLDSSYYGVVNDRYFTIEDDQILVLKKKGISLLDYKEQQLLYDRYTLKKSILIIAKEHNTTENNIYQKLFRLKQKTKKLVENILNE